MAGCKIIIQKSITFFFTEQLEIEIKIVPFKRAPKSTKYLELSLNKICAMSIN